MNVMEIYRSVQGEGTLMGVPTTFVRFFACNLRCSWCFVPDTPVLMADWSWRRLGDLQVGDLIFGIERQGTPRSHQQLVKTTVERVSTRLAPTVIVNAEVRCTADHKFWLTPKDAGKGSAVHSGWREVQRAVGMRVQFVADPIVVSQRSDYSEEVAGFYLSNSQGQQWCILANARPSKASIVDSSFGRGAYHSRVIESVVSTGDLEPVITLTTSCGSYVAAGYVVKNCDTKYSWSVHEGGTWEVMSAEQVADQVAALGTRHVVLTGGEPTLQRDLVPLAQILKRGRYHLTIETNTTIFPAAAVPLIDLWSLSPKLTSAGQGYLRFPIIEHFLSVLRPDQQQWKFVVRDNADEQCLRAFLEHYPVFVERRLPIVLQPEGDVATQDYPAALERLAERVRDPFWDRYYVRVLPQMHVIVWGRRRWV